MRPSYRTYHLTTFGCQMNEHDSERMKGMLESLGYGEAPTRDQADLILFNTCSIREKADNRLVGHLGEAKRLKSQDPERVIGIGGCWSQSMKERVFEQFPFVDVAFGPGQVHKLAEFLTSDSLTAQGYFEFEGFTGHLPMKREREHQAWVQISVGCNCRCAYCIVPSTRGREVSRPPQELVEEVERLAEAAARAFGTGWVFARVRGALGADLDDVRAVHFAFGPADARELREEWVRHGPRVPLEVHDAPYRDLGPPLLDYLRSLTAEEGATVFALMPEVVTRGWRRLLHNQRALYVKRLLLFEPGVVLASVPYQILR